MVLYSISVGLSSYSLRTVLIFQVLLHPHRHRKWVLDTGSCIKTPNPLTLNLHSLLPTKLVQDAPLYRTLRSPRYQKPSQVEMAWLLRTNETTQVRHGQYINVLALW